jgi:general secretion pathway protein G
LQTAIGEFHTKTGKYPPSKLKLYANGSQYASDSDPVAQASLLYLNEIWPNLGNNFTGAAWAGSAAIPAGGVLLEGDQCLVFFLGGIPIYQGGAVVGLAGFSNDPQHPWTTTDQQRTRYFFFENARLFQRNGNPFPSYQDFFSVGRGSPQPYMYFSSGNRKNGYDPAPTTLGVTPYSKPGAGAVIQYWEPDSFQLISSGADGLFGPGGAWSSSTANTIPQAGKDDLTNFYQSKMGVTQ